MNTMHIQSNRHCTTDKLILGKTSFITSTWKWIECNQIRLLCLEALCCIMEYLVLEKKLFGYMSIFTFSPDEVLKKYNCVSSIDFLTFKNTKCLFSKSKDCLHIHLRMQMCFLNIILDLNSFPQILQGRETPSR